MEEFIGDEEESGGELGDVDAGDEEADAEELGAAEEAGEDEE